MSNEKARQVISALAGWTRKPGYYRSIDTSPFAEIIHCTGDRRGNYYKRHGRGFSTGGWCSLVWTCVPTQKVLDAEYVWFAEDPGFKE